MFITVHIIFLIKIEGLPMEEDKPQPELVSGVKPEPGHKLKPIRGVEPETELELGVELKPITDPPKPELAVTGPKVSLSNEAEIKSVMLYNQRI